MVASVAECGDQVLDPAGLVFCGGFLRLDGLDEVLTQTHPAGRLLGRQPGAPAGDVQPLTQRRTRRTATRFFVGANNASDGQIATLTDLGRRNRNLT